MTSDFRHFYFNFGMFDFNTVDPVWLRRRISEAKNEEKVLVPDVDFAYKVCSGAGSWPTSG